MTLTTWIRQQGGTTKVGRLLKVSSQRVHAWTTYTALPQATIMQRIVRLTHGRVSYAAMIEDYIQNHVTKSAK